MERDVIAQLTKELKARGWITFKMHGGPYMPPGIPDLWCGRKGITLWLEVKQPTRFYNTSEAQRVTLNRLQGAGFAAYCTDGVLAHKGTEADAALGLSVILDQLEHEGDRLQW